MKATEGGIAGWQVIHGSQAVAPLKDAPDSGHVRSNRSRLLEFGLTPQLGTQGSTDGLNHMPEVLSMAVAGGGFRHGQVIGATTKDGASIKERPVTAGDLAATIYHHMGVPLDATYLDHSGRPRSIVENGKVIQELV